MLQELWLHGRRFQPVPRGRNLGPRVKRGTREIVGKKRGLFKPSSDARRHYPLLLILYPLVSRLFSGYLLNVTYENTLVFSPAVIYRRGDFLYSGI